MTESHPARMGHIPVLQTSPSAPPIFQTTAFDIPDLDVLQQLYGGTAKGHIYTRDSNPNHSALAESIAALENAEAGAAFSSGMGAIAATVMSLAGAGDHVIVAQSLYGITLKLMGRMQKRFNVQSSYVDACDPAAVKAAIRPNTKMAIVETVSNPLLEVCPLPEIVAALGDIPLVVDSTFTTPELIQPLSHGAAVVVHSGSKYLNGHGDVMLGVAAGRDELIREIRSTASTFGQNANPFESWLTQRGLRTLPLRMKQIVETTHQVAQFLMQHPKVSQVFHPSLAHHTTAQTAQRLYPNGVGGIVAFELKDGDLQAVNRLFQATPDIPFSPTLADSRTTFSHPATTSHGFMTSSRRLELGITDGLVRLSVGLESAAQIQNELDAGLQAAVA